MNAALQSRAEVLRSFGADESAAAELLSYGASGFGSVSVSGRRRAPSPPQRITA